MQPGDLLRRQEPGPPRARVRADPGRRVGGDAAVRDRMVQDRAQHRQCLVRPAGRRPAVGVEPPFDACPPDPVQGKRTERRQKLPVQYAVLDLPRRRLQPGAACRPPRPLRGYEPPEGRRPFRRPARVPRNARGLKDEAFPARLVRALQRRRTERHPPGAAVVDPTPRPAGAHPHPEGRDAGVPDRIFPIPRLQPCDTGVAQAHPPVRHHRSPSTAPSASTASRAAPSAGCAYPSVVAACECPRSRPITGTVSPRRSARLA